VTTSDYINNFMSTEANLAFASKEVKFEAISILGGGDGDSKVTTR
jgi:hypothetical protein